MRNLVGSLVGGVLFGVVGLALASCATECDQAPTPDPIGAFRGELTQLSEVSSSFFDDDVHRASIDTGTETISFEVRGRGGLLVVGETYEVELRQSDADDPTSLYAFILVNGGCGGSPSSTIWLVDADRLIEIEKPDRFRFPLSTRNILLGFGAFVALVAIFGRSPSE